MIHAAPGLFCASNARRARPLRRCLSQRPLGSERVSSPLRSQLSRKSSMYVRFWRRARLARHALCCCPILGGCKPASRMDPASWMDVARRAETTKRTLKDGSSRRGRLCEPSRSEAQRSRDRGVLRPIRPYQQSSRIADVFTERFGVEPEFVHCIIPVGARSTDAVSHGLISA